MDTVFVSNLAVETIIGIHPNERTTPQQVLISFELHADTRTAAHSDDIAHALDYDGASRRITELVGASRFHLIETMAERIASLLLETYPVAGVSVEVRKPAALSDAETVGVRIERSGGTARR
jgi:dihydroneopterin aldolase